jgi:hypothetical protein
MNWKKIFDIIDEVVRSFSIFGVAVINYAAGIYIGIQLLPYNQTIASFLLFISATCPTYLFLSYIVDSFLKNTEKKDGQNVGNNNAGKS